MTIIPKVPAPEIPDSSVIKTQITPPQISSAVPKKMAPSVDGLTQPTKVPEISQISQPTLSLPKVPPIPATGESGISSGGGPKFLSDVIKKTLSIVSGI